MNRVKPLVQNSESQLPPLRSNSQFRQQYQSSAIALHRELPLQQVQRNEKNPSRQKVKRNTQNQDIKQILEQNHQLQPLQLQQTQYTCRICLQQGPALHANNQEQFKSMQQKLLEQVKLKQPKYLITACRCQGTAGYVHQRCMIQWIDTQYKRSKQKQMKCEICLEEILYNRRMIHYFDCKITNLENVSPCNIAFFSSLMIILAVFIGILIKANQLSLNKLTQVTIFVLMGIMSVAFIVSILIIIREAFYKHKKETVKIYSNDEIDIYGIQKNNLTHYQIRSSTHRTNTNARSVRSVRSARSVRERASERRRQNNQQASQRPHWHHSSRNNIVENRQSQSNIPPRSTRQIRSARQPNSTRSIQVRSRQNLDE